MRQNSPTIRFFYIAPPVILEAWAPWASSFSKEVSSEPTVDVSMEEASLHPPSRGTVDGRNPAITTWDGAKTPVNNGYFYHIK